MAADVTATAGTGSGEISPASLLTIVPPGTTDLKKWSKVTIMGRYMLIAESQPPTTFIQAQDGLVRKGEHKGKVAKNRGKRFNVLESSAKAVLIAVAIWDEQGNSETNFPGNGCLAARTGLKIGAVNKVVRVLTQAGWLWKTPRGNITNSKRCHLDWDLIEANQAKYVAKEKTWDGYVPANVKPNLPTRPAKQNGSAINPVKKKIIPRPGERDPIREELVQAVMGRLQMHDPDTLKVAVKLIEPVLRQLRQEDREPDAILDAVAGMKNWQWRGVAQAKNPAGFMRVALDNALDGMTEDQVRQLRPKDGREEDEDEN